MIPTPLLLFHVCTATAGLFSGFLAMLFRKGSGLHAAAGTIFFVSMLGMSTSAAVIATFYRPDGINLVVAVLIFYLVSTAWIAVRRRVGAPGIVDRAALLMAAAAGAGSVIWGFQIVGRPAGVNTGVPAPLYFIFGAILLLHAASDVRMIRRGGVTGAKRIVRHLWRMSFALLITTFALGRLASPAMRRSILFYTPHVLLAATIVFWLVRYVAPAAGRPLRRLPAGGAGGGSAQVHTISATAIRLP
jgi:uncharacterized membrane protein